MSGEIEDTPDRGLEDTEDASSRRSVAEAIADADLSSTADVLLLGPMRKSLDDDACASLLDPAWSPGGETDRNVLFVSLTQSADERISMLEEHTSAMPDRVAVVSGADQFPSETTIENATGTTKTTVEVVSDPSDLPRLGMTITKAVSEWDPDDETVVCFHSLTALLQYAEPKRAFRFVHLLQNRLNAAAHYHMDAEAHDLQTIATLRPLFDAVVEYDADGTVNVTD